MTIRVIDNKKIDMTNSEWEYYNKIVKSYTTHQNNGSDLFKDLFETNENGIITFLKPPSRNHTTFEIICFLQSLYLQQHMRLIYEQFNDLAAQVKNKLKEIK